MHIRILYLHDEALSNRSAMFSMVVIYTMALLMKCMLSSNNYQANMEQQEHINIRESNGIKSKRRSQNFSADFSFSSSAHSEEDTWCIRSMQCIVGVLSHKEGLKTSEALQHTPKNIICFTSSQDFRAIAKIRNQWKDTFSWSLMSRGATCPPWERSGHPHEEERVRRSLTYGNAFLCEC